MSEQTSPDTGVVDNEVSTSEAAQTNAAQPEVDTQAAPEEATGEAKTFTQEELNDIVKKEKARAEAKAERRVLKALERISPQQAQAQQTYQQPQADQKPTRRDGESDDGYLDRLTDWKLDQRDKASNHQRAQAEKQTLETKTERMYAEAAKVPGFDREEFDSLPLTPVLAQTLLESDQSAKLMAFMSANPEEVSRIATLSPARQAAEIGKLETRLATSTPSKAASPINPIGGGRGTGGVSDPSRMSQEQYEKWRESQGATNRRR